MRPASLLILLLALLAAATARAADSGLRITCEGNGKSYYDINIYLDAKFKGTCPLDMLLPEGKYHLEAERYVDPQHETQRYSKRIDIGSGVMKKVEVRLSEKELYDEMTKKNLLEFGISDIESGLDSSGSILKDFGIGSEVTQTAWEAVMGNNPSSTKNLRLPVTNVSWDDVQEFIARLNQLSGKQYRLPTLTEWERACHMSDLKNKKRKYCGGDDALNEGWYAENSGGRLHSDSESKGIPANMSGNVAEWVNDCHEGKCKIAGGSYADKAEDGMKVREAERSAKSHLVGFRLIRSLP